MHKRKFVMQPLVDIAGNEMHPAFAKAHATLLDECPDDSTITKQPKWLKNPKESLLQDDYNYIAIEGNIGAGRRV